MDEDVEDSYTPIKNQISDITTKEEISILSNENKNTDISTEIEISSTSNFNEDLDKSGEIIITSIINEDKYTSNKVKDITTPNPNGTNESIKEEYSIRSIIKKNTDTYAVIEKSITSNVNE